MTPLRSILALAVVLAITPAVFPAPCLAIGDGGIQSEGGGLAEAVNCSIGLASHRFLTTWREYHFEGSCTVGGYGARPFKAVGTYQPPNGEVYEEISLDHPQIGEIWMRSTARFADDPWLYTGPSPSDLQVTYSDQYHFENIFLYGSYHPFDSRAWITEGARNALIDAAAAAPPPACASGEQTPPAVSRPLANEEFPAGTRRVPVTLTFPCRFMSAAYESRMAYVFVEFQAIVKDYGQDLVMALPIDDANPVMLHPSATDPYDNTSYGSAEIPVDYDGKYNFRFRAQWIDEEGITSSPWTGWIPLWIGPKFSLLTVDTAELLDAISPPALDLAISGVSRQFFPAGAAGPDGKLLDADTWFYRWTVKNLGAHDASSATELQIACSRIGGAEPCPPGKIVGTFPVPAIEPGKSVEIWTSGLPAPAGATDWQFRGKIDPGDKAAEADEANNERVLSEGFIRPTARRVTAAPPKAGGSPSRAAPAKPSVAAPIAKPPGERLKVLPAAPLLAPARVKPATAPAAVAAAPAHLAVSRVYTSPERPRAGAAFDILVELKNTGGTASEKGRQYAVECLATPAGAACPLKEGPRAVGRSVAPGAVLPARLPVASAQAGSYRIRFSPRGGAAADARTLELTVIPAIHRLPGTAKPLKK